MVPHQLYKTMGGHRIHNRNTRWVGDCITIVATTGASPSALTTFRTASSYLELAGASSVLIAPSSLCVRLRASANEAYDTSLPSDSTKPSNIASTSGGIQYRMGTDGFRQWRTVRVYT